MKIVAIDHGYSAIKAMSENKAISFQSRIEETNESINTNETYRVIYNDKTYLVGAGVSMIGIVRNAMLGVNQLQEVGDKISGIFNKIALIADKMVFWN